MNESRAKNALRTLCEDALRCVQEAGDEIGAYRGKIAFYSALYDERFISLPSFSIATAELDALPLIQAQCGPGESKRVALQFIYGFLGALEHAASEVDTFEATWTSFWKELSVAEWTYVGVSNLQNFHSESNLLDLGDGVTIRGRSFEELAGILDWGEWEFDQLTEDWLQGAASSHVILIEHKVRKSPKNLILVDSATPWTKAQKALLALRLIKQGDIRIGRMFLARPAAFNFGIGGGHSTGLFSVWYPGLEYRLEASEITSAQAIYDMLLHLERIQSRAPRNLSLALRSFSSIYERQLNQAEDRVVDAITAIEALLKIGTELSFRAAFRTAGILANDDNERTSLFEEIA
ncbi:MAG: hypothetical protein ACRDGG_03180, partial [Anaerolineae bacterium]